MNVIDILVMLGAALGTAAYVCRLDALRWRTHAGAVILMHIALGAACIFAGFHAWAGESGPLDVAALAGALAWIWISLPTWGGGSVPRQFETGPAPLDDARARQVAGGRQP